MAPTSRTTSNKSSGWADPATRSHSNTNSKHVPFQESHKVKCTKPDCEQLFTTEKDMKRHKKYDPEHFYCRRCDVDCEDWEDLTRHKVDMMAPYIEGKIQPTENDMPKHIVCEFCGEDFQSFGGRKIHRRQAHPADQDVECPGCKSHFIRAANMIDHIENGHCSKIRPIDLYRSICHKFVVKQVMKAPDKFLEPRGPAIEQASETTGDYEDGGVSLLDHEDEAQMGGYKPIPASASHSTVTSPTTSHASASAWPDLPSHQGSLAESMRSMSINSANTAAPHRSNERAYPYATGDSGYGADTVSNTSKASAWNTSNSAASSLFPYSKPTPPLQAPLQPGDWSAILAQREEEALADDSTNIMKAKWWDPSTADYNPHLFWDAGMGVYTCRFPDCMCDGMAFYALADLQDHIKMFHLPDNYRCPACFKRFGKPSSLVAHAETTQKCNVRASGRFKSMIDEISGGLLDATAVNIPKIYRPDTAVVQYGKQTAPANGIMDTKFSGKMPDA